MAHSPHAIGRVAISVAKLACFSILGLSTLPAQNPLFIRSDFPAGTTPKPVASADFNGDSKLDFAVLDTTAGVVRVYLGNGDGTFNPTPVVSNVMGDSLAVGDFNSDGKPDLAVGASFTDSVSLYLNNGSGSFTLSAAPNGTLVLGGNAPSAVAVGDLDGDGKPDVAVAVGNAPTVFILLGNGAGGMIFGTGLGWTSTAFSIALADINNDNKLDIVTADGVNNTVSWSLNQTVAPGTPVFFLTGSVGVGAGAISVAVGNLNADTNRDIAVTTSNNALVVLFGDGSGGPAGFGSPITLTTGLSPRGVAIADFNHDSHADIAVANFTDNTVSLFLSNGNGTFQAKQDFSVGTGPTGLIAPDFNGDLRADIVSTNVTSGNATVLSSATRVTITSSPAGLTFMVGATPYTAPQTFTLPSNSILNVSWPTPQSGAPGVQYWFANWNDSSTANPRAITVPSADITYTGNFNTYFLLTTGVSPVGSGTVTPPTGYFLANSVVNLLATPAGPTWGFDHWTGPVANTTTAATTITMTAPATVTAFFHPRYLLTLSTIPASGFGTISASPTSPDGYYDAGTVVTITATPAFGRTFLGFLGDLTGTTNPQNLTMNSNKTVIADFAFSIPARINSGGAINYNDPAGHIWLADTGYLGGSVYSTSSPVAITNTAYLYQSERWNNGILEYQLPVPAGTYLVKLKFAEIYFTAPNQRKFNVSLNGTQVLTNFDILATAGAPNVPVDRAFVVTATQAVGAAKGSLQALGGIIDLQLLPVLSNPKISAIEITPVQPDVELARTAVDLAPTQNFLFSALVAGTQNQTVTWSISPNIGSIDSTGMYFGPPNTPTQEAFRPIHITVTAQSAADGTKLGTGRITLSNPWNTQDIGGSAGSFASAFAVQTLTGSGDIYGTSDSFRFASLPIQGDATIIARVSVPAAQPRSKVGLMFRNSMQADAPEAFLGIYGGAVGIFESRAVSAGPTTAVFGSAGVFWLRLQRQGNQFTGSVSNDGNAWIPVGSAVVGMGAIVPVGMAVTSGSANPQTAVFDQVWISNGVSISIDQQLASLAAGQSVQLTSTVVGGLPGAVWTLSPPIGSININTGLYTAPASLPFGVPQTVTVTAQSTFDATQSATTVLNLGTFLPVRVNAGGPSHIDPNGVFWYGDTGASAGGTFSSGAPIANTTTPYLYQTEHFNNGAFNYTYVVPNGNYQVKLKFAEIFFTSAGQRTFNVSINGSPVLAAFDVLQQAGGPNRAFDQTFPVTVVNGQIVIQFTPVVSSPKINAIEIQ